MSKQLELVALLPFPTQETARVVKAIAERFDSRPRLFIPSALDGSDIAALRELRNTSAQLASFATTPLQLQETHLQVAIAAAVEYELGRVAIPMHYQNVRDQLQREYGFGGVRDRQVEQILAQSKCITEIRNQVYKSRFRYRDTAARSLIKNWSRVLSDGSLSNVYDLPSYCMVLDSWFELMVPAPGDDIPKLTVPMWLQVKTDKATLLYRADGRSQTAKYICGAGLEFLASTSLSVLLADSISEIDDDVLDQLSKSDAIRKAIGASPVGRAAIDCLQQYAHLWMDYIKNQNLRGQEQKWRGWYLVPEHGPLTLTKLWELQHILVHMSKIEQSGTVLVDTSDAGVANVLSLLKAGGVRYQQSYSADKKRMLFIRQQKNYLFRLGLITEPASSNLAITATGREWLTILGDAELIGAFTAIMEQIRWTWCNMPFFVFARELARKSDGYITYHELFNWVIHAYDQSQLEELVAALRINRQLPDYQRRSVYTYIETKLKSLLDRYMSEAAFGHYRTKIKDLMEAFATTGDFVLKGDRESLRLVLRERKAPCLTNTAEL